MTTVDVLKTCRDCGAEKSISEYHRHNATKDRLQIICKSCMSIRNRIWKRKNPEKLAEYERRRAPRPHHIRRNDQLRREYGIDQTQYDALYAQQHGKCAICNRIPQPTAGKRIALVVDHCHDTGKIRGLLCASCNLAIGHMKDDPERLRAAISYLEG